MTSSIALPLALLLLGANASPTRRPAAALGNPKEDEPATANPVRRPHPSAEADTALARALVYAFEPAPQEIRVVAIQDVGLLGDLRALNPLAHLVFDPNPALQSAALRAVSLFTAPRAEEILCNVARHPSLPERLKLQAIQGLAFQRTASAREFLLQLSTASGTSPAVSSAARQARADGAGSAQ